MLVPAFCCLSAAAQEEPPASLLPPLPRTILLDGVALVMNRDSLQRADERGESLQPALEALIAAADEALQQPPVSVMDKVELPPSDDRHDYMSLALYAWPNPETANGLPYIRKDGEVSPTAYNLSDKRNMGLMQGAVESLGLAYWFTKEERYAQHAALLLRTWFLDTETRMNPNLNYAQAWPGLSEGRFYGIIDTAQLSTLPDYVNLLGGSPAWSEADQRGMEKWCSDYVDWLTASIPGKAEGAAKNNHGSWWDCQVAALALFCGDDELALTTIEAAKQRRIDRHIATHGSQPHELGRTKSWDYSVYNLRALLRLARLGSCAGADLWNHSTPDGAGLAVALEYLLGFADYPQDWPHEQIYEIKVESLRELLLIAWQLSGDGRYLSELDRFSIAPEPESRLRLVYQLP